MTDESTDLTDALNNPDNWSSSGPGTHEINSSEYDISFSYADAENGSITYESTVENDGKLQFSWLCHDSRSPDQYGYDTPIGSIETDTKQIELSPSGSMSSRTVNPLRIAPSDDNPNIDFEFQTRNVAIFDVNSGETIRIHIEARNSGVLSGFFEPAPDEEFVGLLDPTEPFVAPTDAQPDNTSTGRTLQQQPQQQYPTIEATWYRDTHQDSANTKEGFTTSPLPNQKDIEVPVILAEFSDVKNSTPKDYIENVLFRNLDENTRKNNNIESYSVNEYFKEASDEHISYKPTDVIGWVDTGMSRGQAAGPNLLPQKAFSNNAQFANGAVGPYTWSPYDTSPRIEFIKQAIIKGHKQLKNKQRNNNKTPEGLKTYANNSNNELSVCIVFAGISWQHATQQQRNQNNYLRDIADTTFTFELTDNINNTTFTIKIEGHTQTAEGNHNYQSGQNNDIIKGSGTIAHELGHLQFGWGDLYTGGNQPPHFPGEGFSLMGSPGPFGKNNGSPLHPLAFRKVRGSIGWGAAPELPAGSSGILPPAAKVNDFYEREPKNRGSWQPPVNRYVSYRAPSGSDQVLKDFSSNSYYSRLYNKLPASAQGGRDFDGMLVCDTNIVPGLGVNNNNSQVNTNAQLDYSFVQSGTKGTLPNDPAFVNKDYGTILLDNPEHRTLKKDQQAVYAVNTSTGYRTLDSRVSWDSAGTGSNSLPKMEVKLDNGTNKQTAKDRDIAYKSVRTNGLPTKGGYKLTEEAREDVSYYTATNYLREPLPTRLEIIANNSQLDAGDHSSPNQITIEVEAYNGEKTYQSYAAPRFDVTIGGQTVPRSSITIQSGNAASKRILEIQPPQKPAGTHQLGVTLTDRKHGAEHTTKQLTADVTYQGEWFEVEIAHHNTPNPGDKLHVTAVVSNTGLGSGTKGVTFSLYRASDPPKSKTINIPLDPQQATDPSAEFQVNDPGHYTLEIDSGDDKAVEDIYVPPPQTNHEDSTAMKVGKDTAVVSTALHVVGITFLIILMADGGYPNENSVSLDEGSGHSYGADNSPSEFRGETLLTPFAIANPTADPITEEARLRVPGLDVPVTTTEIELASNEFTTGMLSVDLPEDAAGDYTAEIEFDNQSITQPVTIPEPTEPNFGVRVVEERNPVGPDEDAMVTVEARNTGDEEKTAPLMYHLDGDGEGFSGSSITTEVTLGPGEIKTVTLSTPAYSGEGDSDAVEHLPTYTRSYINNQLVSDSIRLDAPTQLGAANFTARIDNVFQTENPYQPGFVSAVEYTVQNDNPENKSHMIGFNYFDTSGGHISGHEVLRTVPGGSSRQFSDEFILETLAGRVDITTPDSDFEGDTTKVSGPNGEEPAYFTVSIDHAQDIVELDKTVDVGCTVTNIGQMEGTQEVTLKQGDSRIVDSTEITLDADDGPTTTTLQWKTSDGDLGSHTLTVESDDDSDTQDVDVLSGPDYGVEVTNITSAIVRGDTAEVDVDITNSGEMAGTTIAYLEEKEVFENIDMEMWTQKDSSSVTVDPGKSESLTLNWATNQGTSLREHDLRVRVRPHDNSDDSDNTTATQKVSVVQNITELTQETVELEYMDNDVDRDGPPMQDYPGIPNPIPVDNNNVEGGTIDLNEKLDANVKEVIYANIVAYPGPDDWPRASGAKITNISGSILTYDAYFQDDNKSGTLYVNALVNEYDTDLALGANYSDNDDGSFEKSGRDSSITQSHQLVADGYTPSEDSLLHASLDVFPDSDNYPEADGGMITSTNDYTVDYKIAVAKGKVTPYITHSWIESDSAYINEDIKSGKMSGTIDDEAGAFGGVFGITNDGRTRSTDTIDLLDEVDDFGSDNKLIYATAETIPTDNWPDCQSAVVTDVHDSKIDVKFAIARGEAEISFRYLYI